MHLCPCFNSRLPTRICNPIRYIIYNKQSGILDILVLSTSAQQHSRAARSPVFLFFSSKWGFYHLISGILHPKWEKKKPYKCRSIPTAFKYLLFCFLFLKCTLKFKVHNVSTPYTASSEIWWDQKSEESAKRPTPTITWEIPQKGDYLREKVKEMQTHVRAPAVRLNVPQKTRVGFRGNKIQRGCCLVRFKYFPLHHPVHRSLCIVLRAPPGKVTQATSRWEEKTIVILTRNVLIGMVVKQRGRSGRPKFFKRFC